MQEQDVVTNTYVEDNDRFADIFNGGFYDGCQVMNPSKLKKLDRTSGTVLHLPGEEKVNEAVTKYRDVVKESDFGISRIITAIENQSEIHYAMPVKVLTLDAYGYDQQLAQIRKMHREKKDVQGADHQNEFRHIKEDAYNVITELTNSKELSKMKESIVRKGDDVDMCKAIQEMMEDSKNEGRTEGEYRKLIELIIKKVQKNKVLGQIAEELEESEDVIRPLYEAVLKEEPEYNIDRILELF